MDPLVTVIVPVAAAHITYLPDAIGSLKNQTVQTHKLIVVNDTGKALRVDSGALVLNTRGQAGAAAARNLALSRTTTPFVTFLDADDLLVNTAIETLLRAYATYPEACYIYGDCWHDTNGALTYYRAPLYDRTYLIGGGNIHNVTALVPTQLAKAVGGFDEVARWWEDWDFYIRMALAGYCGVKVPAPIIRYRMHTGLNRQEHGRIGNELIAEVRARYAGYVEGSKKLMGCGGGCGDKQTLARQILDGLPPDELRAGDVVLEYLGPNAGSISFRVNGTTYRGANNAIDKFVRVKPADADYLVGLGVWRKVPNAALRAQVPEAAVIQARHKPEPQVTIPRMETAQVLGATVTVPQLCACGHIVNFHAERGCQALLPSGKVCGCRKFHIPTKAPPKENHAESKRAPASARKTHRNKRALS